MYRPEGVHDNRFAGAIGVRLFAKWTLMRSTEATSMPAPTRRRRRFSREFKRQVVEETLVRGPLRSPTMHRVNADQVRMSLFRRPRVRIALDSQRSVPHDSG